MKRDHSDCPNRPVLDPSLLEKWFEDHGVKPSAVMCVFGTNKDPKSTEVHWDLISIITPENGQVKTMDLLTAIGDVTTAIIGATTLSRTGHE